MKNNPLPLQPIAKLPPRKQDRAKKEQRNFKIQKFSAKSLIDPYKSTYQVRSLSSGKDGSDTYNWFDPSNTFPTLINEALLKAETLLSVYLKYVSYCIGNDILLSDNLISALKLGNKDFDFENFYEHVFLSKKAVENVFVKIVKIDNGALQLSVCDYSKCSLDKKGNVLIRPNRNSNDKQKKVPLFPNWKTYRRNSGKPSEFTFQETVLHIKNKVSGFDHYGFPREMYASLGLNSIEIQSTVHQNSQLDKGFSKQIAIISEYALKESELELQTYKNTGAENAGGIFNLVTEGRPQLIELDSERSFNYTDSPSVQKIHNIWSLAQSLVGNKTAGTFSVEQVESDWNQLMNSVESEQKFINQKLVNVLSIILGSQVTIETINYLPQTIAVNYTGIMNEDQKNRLAERILTKLGVK